MRTLILILSLLAASLPATAQCSFAVSPNTASFPANGGAGLVSITASGGTCNWTTVSNVAWITVSFGQIGTNNGTAGYTVAANSGSQRTGTLTIAGQIVTVTQAASNQPAVCTFTFSPAVSYVAAGGGNITVQIAASSNSCDRPVMSTVPWITISSGQTGTGNGSFSFTVAPNVSGMARNGDIRIGGQMFSVGQEASPCNLVLTPSQVTVPVIGGVGTFNISTTCAWTAVASDPWIAISSAASGTGAGNVSYGVAANSTTSARSGSITVGPAVFQISQPGIACDIQIDFDTTAIGASGGLRTLQISAPSTCGWAVLKTADWISFTTAVTGTGDGSIGFTVAANPSIQTRTADLIIGNKVHRVTQTGAACTVSVSPSSLTVAAAGAAASVAITANCDWRASTNSGWIQITSAASGSSSATLALTVAPNTSAGVRTGAVTVNGETVAITQPSQRCTLTLSSNSLAVPARGGLGAIQVSGGTSCTWEAITGEPWLLVRWESVGGSGVVTVRAAMNRSSTGRSGNVFVGGQTLVVSQPGLAPRITAIVNAASFLAAPVAPGQMVTFYGEDFGPGETRVLFDGVAASILFAGEGQVNAIAPYSIAGKLAVHVQVEYAGVTSPVISLLLAASNPAVFAVVNQDGRVNSSADPAVRGQVIQIFATGEGQTVPPGVDGSIAVGPVLPRPVLPVRVFIGGVEARVTYAGAAPGAVAGLMQVNATVPASGPLTVRVGEVDSPAFTVFVQ